MNTLVGTTLLNLASRVNLIGFSIFPCATEFNVATMYVLNLVCNQRVAHAEPMPNSGLFEGSCIGNAMR